MLTLEEFLYNGGTDLQSVVSTVDSSIGIHHGDQLVAVGSLAEGLGSIKSDLDLFLITSRNKKDLPANEHVGLVVGNCIVDILILPFAKVKKTLSRFRQWSSAPWNLTYAAKFNIAERTLLHRLTVGRVLISKDDKLEKLKPSPIDLARLKLHVARQDARTIQVDMIGYRDEGDFHSLLFAAQTILGHVVDALLAGHLLINPLLKWRSRLLQFLPPDWEEQLPVRATGLTANERIWELHRGPKTPNMNACLEHALKILSFARAVFLWSEHHLLSGKKLLSIPQAFRKMDGTPLPFLDLDVDCILTDHSLIAGRLNEFTAPLKLTRREGEMLLFFDGVTTIEECKQAFQIEQNEIDELLNKIAKANLTIELYSESKALT